MGKAKNKQEIIIKHANRFAVLADSDNDSISELPDYAPISPRSVSLLAEEEECQEREERREGREGQEEEEEEECRLDDLAKDSAFRIWKTDDAKRFFSDTNNIFSSPFSHKKGLKKFKEDNDGWVSIQMDDTQTFPSMLTRGKSDDIENARAWAEIVTSTLDKAGQQRKEKYKESLSFFRRPDQ